MNNQETITRVLMELVDEGELHMGVDPITGQVVFWHVEPALVEQTASVIS